MSSTAEEKKRVLEFIRKRIQAKGKLPIGWDVETFDYRESGAIDSMGIIKFLLDLEAEFDISISDGDMLRPGFTTVGGLTGLVVERLHQPADHTSS